MHDGSHQGFVGGLPTEFGRAQGSAHEAPRVAELHVALDAGAGAQMDFTDAAGLDYSVDVARCEPAAGHDDDAAARLLLKFTDQIQAFQSRGFLTRGEHPVDAQADEVFEGCPRIAAHIEGAMESDVERAGQLDQFGGASKIDVARGGEAAKHDAVGAQTDGHSDIFGHDGEFSVGIKEIAATGPDNDLEAKPRFFAGEPDLARAGGCAAFQKIIAEFDPVRATTLRGNGAFDGINTDLDFHLADRSRRGR